MATKETRPAGANWLTPYLTVGDVEASLAFYQKAFGFATGFTMPGPGGKIVHADMRYQGTGIIMLAPEGAWGGTCKTPAHSGVEPSVGFYVYCEDVDALAVQAKDAGAAVVSGPEDQFWGDRTVSLRDPDGYVWTFATKVGEFDASKVPPV